jgi:tripartite ATP-independent transporter DctM subunit
MLIPPSVLMIVWGVLTELSIGKLFLAGVLPGLLLTMLFCAYAVGAAVINPQVAGGGRPVPAAAPLGAAPAQVLPVESDLDQRPIGPLLASTGLVIVLIAGCLGSIWLGLCTPTEGAGIGAVGGLLLALIKGISLRDAWQVVLNVGRTAGPLLLLLFCAQLYSRVLSMTGFTDAAKTFLLGTGLGAGGILAMMVGIWVVLGCLIDSISIILLTVPIFAPIAAQLGYDPLAFAIIGILAIETGLLTPPFGLCVFTVKAALPDRSVELAEIFRGAVPYWIALLLVVLSIVLVPGIATYLPSL